MITRAATEIPRNSGHPPEPSATQTTPPTPHADPQRPPMRQQLSTWTEPRPEPPIYLGDTPLGRHDRRLVSGISRRSPCEQEDLSAINRFRSELLTRPKPATRIVASADPRADAGARSTTRPG